MLVITPRLRPFVLYRRRAFVRTVQAGRPFRRMFDKAGRTKPPVVAADAGPMQIQWRESEASRYAAGVQQGLEENTMHPGAGRIAILSLMESVEKRGDEIGSRQNAEGRGVAKHAKFSCSGQRFHAAAGTGGERSWIWAAVSVSMITIGPPPHLEQSQKWLDSVAGKGAMSAAGAQLSGGPLAGRLASTPAKQFSYRSADPRSGGDCLETATRAFTHREFVRGRPTHTTPPCWSLGWWPV